MEARVVDSSPSATMKDKSAVDVEMNGEVETEGAQVSDPDIISESGNKNGAKESLKSKAVNGEVSATDSDAAETDTVETKKKRNGTAASDAEEVESMPSEPSSTFTGINGNASDSMPSEPSLTGINGDASDSKMDTTELHSGESTSKPESVGSAESTSCSKSDSSSEMATTVASSRRSSSRRSVGDSLSSCDIVTDVINSCIDAAREKCEEKSKCDSILSNVVKENIAKNSQYSSIDEESQKSSGTASLSSGSETSGQGLAKSILLSNTRRSRSATPEPNKIVINVQTAETAAAPVAQRAESPASKTAAPSPVQSSICIESATSYTPTISSALESNTSQPSSSESPNSPNINPTSSSPQETAKKTKSPKKGFARKSVPSGDKLKKGQLKKPRSGSPPEKLTKHVVTAEVHVNGDSHDETVVENGSNDVPMVTEAVVKKKKKPGKRAKITMQADGQQPKKRGRGRPRKHARPDDVMNTSIVSASGSELTPGVTVAEKQQDIVLVITGKSNESKKGRPVTPKARKKSGSKTPKSGEKSPAQGGITPQGKNKKSYARKTLHSYFKPKPKPEIENTCTANFTNGDNNTVKDNEEKESKADQINKTGISKQNECPAASPPLSPVVTKIVTPGGRARMTPGKPIPKARKSFQACRKSEDRDVSLSPNSKANLTLRVPEIEGILGIKTSDKLDAKTLDKMVFERAMSRKRDSQTPTKDTARSILPDESGKNQSNTPIMVSILRKPVMSELKNVSESQKSQSAEIADSLLSGVTVSKLSTEQNIPNYASVTVANKILMKKRKKRKRKLGTYKLPNLRKPPIKKSSKSDSGDDSKTTTLQKGIVNGEDIGQTLTNNKTLANSIGAESTQIVVQKKKRGRKKKILIPPIVMEPIKENDSSMSVKDKDSSVSETVESVAPCIVDDSAPKPSSTAESQETGSVLEKMNSEPEVTCSASASTEDNTTCKVEGEESISTEASTTKVASVSDIDSVNNSSVHVEESALDNLDASSELCSGNRVLHRVRRGKVRKKKSKKSAWSRGACSKGGKRQRKSEEGVMKKKFYTRTKWPKNMIPPISVLNNIGEGSGVSFFISHAN